MLVFGFWMNAIIAFVAVLLLGFADSFGLAAQGSYFLSLDASQKVGSGVSLAIYSVFYKVGQMLGPLIFGALIAFGVDVGTRIIGVFTAVLIIAYVVLNIKVKAKPTNKSLDIG